MGVVAHIFFIHRAGDLVVFCLFFIFFIIIFLQVWALYISKDLQLINRCNLGDRIGSAQCDRISASLMKMFPTMFPIRNLLKIVV